MLGESCPRGKSRASPFYSGALKILKFLLLGHARRVFSVSSHLAGKEGFDDDGAPNTQEYTPITNRWFTKEPSIL